MRRALSIVPLAPTALARHLLGVASWTLLLGGEVVAVVTAYSRCWLVGHDGRWMYRHSAGEWVCRCRHCDTTLGRKVGA